MRNYSDPTANAAIGAVERELREKKKTAKKLKELRKSGLLTEEMLMQARRQFTGIFTHLYSLIFDED